MDETKEEHPSYGMIDIARVTTTPKQPLFGSSILHGELIALRIKHAEVDRHLNRHWYFGRNEIVEVWMSYSQFTQAIMSMNTSGVPVTIKHIYNKSVEQKEDLKNTKELFSKEFQSQLNKTLRQSHDMIDKINNICNSPNPIKKSERQELRSLADSININLKSNLKFILQSFEEQMNETITEATGEIESFFENKIRSLGIESLQEKIIELPNLNGEKTS